MPDNLIRNQRITVYSSKDCFKCRLTTKMLDKHGVEYREVRLDKDPEALAMVKSKGFQSAPVVHVSDGDKWWDDFRVDKLRALIAGVKK
ncbi:NrdH-like glutaredoxin [Mycobacterium phage Carlyle]|nr:NrdH-like glutaredoxin [Mycobacterium phage Carlyle]